MIRPPAGLTMSGARPGVTVRGPRMKKYSDIRVVAAPRIRWEIDRWRRQTIRVDAMLFRSRHRTCRSRPRSITPQEIGGTAMRAVVWRTRW